MNLQSTLQFVYKSGGGPGSRFADMKLCCFCNDGPGRGGGEAGVPREMSGEKYWRNRSTLARPREEEEGKNWWSLMEVMVVMTD